MYDPRREGFNKTYKLRTLIVQLPRDDLDLYYQWFLRKQYGSWLRCFVEQEEVIDPSGAKRIVNTNTKGMMRPLYGVHVTVVGGKEQGYKSLAWGKHEGKKIEIYYRPQLTLVHQMFWTMPVKSAELKHYRRELGLDPDHNFHLTIGRVERNLHASFTTPTSALCASTCACGK